jgi:peptide/nickel transport system permease protein
MATEPGSDNPPRHPVEHVGDDDGGGGGGRYTAVDAAADVSMVGPSYMPLASTRRPDSTDQIMRRSLLGQALHDTFGQTGARLGAIWIAILGVFAVFAPFLANSHPLLMRERGGPLTSPLLRSLGPIDAALLLLFLHAIWVLVRRPTAGRALALLFWPVMVWAVVAGLAAFGRRMAMFRSYRPLGLEAADGPAAVLGWGWVILVNGVLVLGVVAGLLLTLAATRSFFRAAGRSRYDLVGAVVTAFLLAVASVTIETPQNPVYERYREMEEARQLDLVVRTIIPYSPNDRLRDQPDATLRPPDREHWLGTTQYGEDMLSRMLYATRVALAIGVIATSIATVIGIVVGGLMGYFSGTVDLLGMRVLEIVEAIPTLILLLIVTVFFGRSLYLMMVVIGLVSWTTDARFIRAEFLKLRNLDFVQAATAVGLRRASIIFRHMLPNGVAPVLVHASFGIAGAILLESTLSFLGLGLGPDDPSWGQLLNQARSGGRGFSWWIATFPGAAIFLTVFAYVLIGEALRDAIDPRMRKRD